MKLGILLSRVPYPLEKGDKLRAYHQIKELSKNHEIYLCSIAVGKIKASDLEKIKPYCKEIKLIRLNRFSIFFNLLHGLLFTKLPLQVAYFFKKAAKNKVQNFFLGNQVDHIFCQLIRVSEYVKEIKEIPKTLDYMDALSCGMERRVSKAKFYKRPFIKLEALRLKRYEHFIFPSFDHKTIISEQDRELIIHANNHDITIIRNGVDRAFFKPIKVEKKYDLLFTGNMSYPPNIDGVSYLVEEVLPQVQLERPTIKLAIVGANPSQRVQRLASSNVEVTGWVDDIRLYYASSRLFIAPMLIGTGLQNKLLEAMAMKIPCITTPLANNALKAIQNESILIADSKESFKEQIMMLLENDKKAEEISQNGYEFISNNYDWESCSKHLEELFLKSKK